MPNKIEKAHFHTFDALRFISFLLVFLHHIPRSESTVFDFISHSGGIGVQFFFVLSGFLISYILIREKINEGKINLTNFYIRRALRIWPLFYLAILFAYGLPLIMSALGIPNSTEGYTPNIYASLLFCENYMMMWTSTFPDGAPLRVMWSLCIEEHFYILWSIAIAFIPIKRIPVLIIISILGSIFIRVLYSYLNIDTLDIFSNLIFFASGSIPAYLYLTNRHFFSLFDRFPNYTKVITSVLTLFFIFAIPQVSNPFLSHWSYIIVSFLFTLTISLTLSSRPLKIKDSYWISRLGKYTYGLYIYHTIVILFLIQIAKMFSVQLSWWVLFIVSLLITVLISYISYELFENKFLELKKRFRQ